MRKHRDRQQVFEQLEGRVLLSSTFTVAAISDTQYVVESHPETFIAQTQWLADHAADPSWNMAFMAHEGDMLRRGYSNYQAANADAALNLLNGKVPYLADIGNHDFDNQFDDLDHHISSANFTSWFGDSRYQALYGDQYGSSLDQRNKYVIFNGGGQDYLVLSIEWEAPDSAIAWAQGVINSHRQLPVILTTHEYLNGSGRTTSPLDPLGNSGQNIYSKLVKPNPQIFLVLSGHTGAVIHQTSLNNAGSQVFETCEDFEGRNSGNSGYMQLFRFDPANNKIDVLSYSPTLNQYDTSSTGQFTLSFNFASRFSFATSAPVANDDSYVTLPGSAISSSVVANDFDSLANPLSASLVAGTTHGSLALNADGTFTYTPAPGYAGPDSFTYTISDGRTSNVATATIQVNTPPAAVADAAATPEGKSLTINVVANDSDADGNALSTLLVSLPAHGAVFANANGTFTYTPDPRFVGSDSFSYCVSDGVDKSAPLQVSVTIRPAAPVYDYPISETTTTGTRSGSYLNLAASDGVEETITEKSVSGSAKLDARWQFNVTGGADVIFAINAHRSLGTDEYHFQYSTNGSTFSDMTQFVPASSRDVTRVLYDDQEPYQMWMLPATTRGTVWIRAYDTKSNSDICSLSIDEMFIRSGVDFPTLSIAAANGAETLAGNAPLTFTISRTGSGTSIRNPLTVAYALSGSANAGDDYAVPAGTLTIPAGASSATFSLTPINDGLVEGPETVIATLLPDAAYDLATPSATAIIADMGPTSLSATPNTDPSAPAIALAWTDNNAGESGFLVQRSSDGVNFTDLVTLPADSSNYTDANLPQNTTYTYRVAAVSGSLSTPFSNTAAATTPTDIDVNPPDAPANFQVVATTSSSVSLAWNPSSDNFGVSGYDIYRNNAYRATVDTNSFTDTALASGTAYTYYVVARDAAGNVSSPSNTVTATTLAVAPSAPSNLSASYNKGSRKATLNWTDTSSNETGFRIWYSTNNGSTWSLYTTVSANTTSFTTSALTRGKTYLFKLTAYNDAGDSLFSNTVTVVAK